MKTVDIRITNSKELIAVLRDIQSRSNTYSTDWNKVLVYEQSISTLIKVLEEAK